MVGLLNENGARGAVFYAEHQSVVGVSFAREG
jgi:hypothetical protein